MSDKLKKLLWFSFLCLCIFIVIAGFFEKQKDFWTYFYMVLFFILACVSANKIIAKKEMSADKRKALARYITQHIDTYVQNEPKESEYQEKQEFDTADMLDSGFEEYPVFSMSYKDSSGALSKREIVLKSITLRDDKVYLNAFCMLRKEDRMFLTDRITRIEYKNEVISNPIVYFRDIFMHSDGYAVYHFMQEKTDVFKLFMFLAKADGKIAKAEIDVISEYLKEHMRAISDKTAENAIKNIPVVSIAEFNTILKKLKKEPADNADILEYYKKLCELKKKPDPLERGIFEKVTTSLGA